MSCKVAFPIVEDFSHFEGVSPLPFPETFPSWPVGESHKSESSPGLEHTHETIDAPMLLSFSSVKEPPMLVSFSSGKEPPAFLSFMSGKDSDVFATELAASISGCFSASFSAMSGSPLPLTLPVTPFSTSPNKPSVIGTQFCETLLLTLVVKQETKEEQKLDNSDSCTSIISVDVHSSSSSLLSETISPSPDSSSPFTLLSLLDGDRKVLPERKTKLERKPAKREREEKKQSLFKRGRKKRNSDESDGSEFDSNDSGCWAESKKERNKKAASNYRKRRKMYVNELEAKVAGLEEKARKDRACISSMTDEMQVLKDRMECLERLLSQHNIEVPKNKASTNKSNKKQKN